MLANLTRSIGTASRMETARVCSCLSRFSINQLPVRSLSASSLGGRLQFEPRKTLTFQDIQVRYKFDKRKRNKRTDDDDEDESDVADFESLQDGKDNKVTKIKVTSLRADLLIKNGLGMARNKVEATFYDSKIRINGKKISKKSVSVKNGDEIDVIKEFSPVNPANLVVARIEVLSVHPNAEDITVILRRFKSLTMRTIRQKMPGDTMHRVIKM